MSRASNGTYTAPANSFNPAVEGTAIDETDWNAILDDVETALTDSLSVSGKGKITAHIDFDENASPGTPTSNVGRLYAGDDSGLTTLYWKDASGNTYNLLQGASSSLTYRFDTSTATNSDPGNGEIRFNNTTVSSVTEIAIDDLTSPGADVSAYVLSWDSATSDVRGTMIVQKSTSQTTFAIFNVTGESVDESGYTRLTVTYVTHNGTFVANDPLLVTFTASGTGTTGLPGSATSYDYETRAAAVLATIPGGNTFLRTAGYTTKGDGGGALYTRVVSEPSHAGKLQSADGAWWELGEAVVSPRMFGAAMDGTSNDTTAFANFLAYCGTTGVSGLIPAGTLATSSVSVTCSSDTNIECRGSIKNRDGTSASSGLVRLIDGTTKTKKLRWSGGWIDGNDSAHTAFRFDTWRDADVEIDGVANLLGTVSSTGTFSGVYSSDCVTSRTTIRRARDMAQGGAVALGSVPRVWSVGGSAGSQATLIMGDVTDVHGGVVVGNMGGGTVDIRFEGVCRRVTDNGVYNVGDASLVRVFDPVFDTIDEPFVNTGSGVLDIHGGYVTNAVNAVIGLQNCGDVRVKGLRAERNAQIAKFRPDNISCGALEIEDCTFDHVIATVHGLSFSTGAGTRLIDKNNRWTFHHDSAAGSGATILGCDSDSFAAIESEGSQWVLEDDTGDVGAVTYFISMPTVTEQSWWRSRLVNRTGNANCILRLTAARQQLFAFDDLFAVNNIQSESAVNRNDLTTAAPRVVWGTAVPSSGYWPAGSIVRNIAPSSAGTLGWTCVTAGSPGTWITLTHALIGTNVQAFDADLAALAANGTNGLWARTGSGTGAARTITAPAAGITVSNGDGAAGNPTLALANDLAVLEGLSATGLAARTGSDAWAQRTITGTANQVSIANGDGVAGNPTISLPSTLNLSGTLTTAGVVTAGTTAGTAVKLDPSGFVELPEISAPLSPASGFLRLYAKSDGKAYQKNDAGSETDLSQAGGGGGSGSPSMPQGRLTLTTATPVLTSNTTGQTTVYYAPYTGRYVPLYDGTNWTMTDIGGELSQATTDTTKSPAAVTTNSNYDLFVWNDGGTYRCTRGPAWSSATARGTGAGTTELERVNGILVNKVAITNGPVAQRGTYVGTIRTNGSSQVDVSYGGTAAGGTAASFGVWNMYNRVNVAADVRDNTDSWSYSTTSFRAANASNNMRVSFVSGLDEDGISATYSAASANSSSNAMQISIGYDSTTSPSGTYQLWNASSIGPSASDLRMRPGLGFHYVQALERGNTDATFYGDNGSGTVVSTGLSFAWRC